MDASHCQGCSAQFTFINRKHHCRRCGGIFCGSCTNQRMVLRGQGDSPVRICDPCKKLEEAARFELRHGLKNRSSRGGLKVTANSEDEVLNQILGTDVKQPSNISNVLSEFGVGSSNVSSSGFNEEAISLSIAEQKDTEEDIGSYSPEDLRQQSVEEKKKYRILKGEGKPEEALRAFKRGKELERQAKALEVTLKKNSRKVLSSNSLAGKTNEASERSFTKSKSSHSDKEETNDLASELRELGWSDADLHEGDKKPAKTSLESELSTLLGEVHKKSGASKGTGSIDKTQVFALKKKALTLKREGKLAEAKEELKKAKVLEKQLEEQEFLADADDSDDELSALIRSMGDDKQDDFSLKGGQDTGFDYSNLDLNADLGFDGNFEATEEDMEDPEIAAALETLGWTGASEHPVVPAAQAVPADGTSLSNDILALKKEALRQKQAGNLDEAMTMLRKAKLLERDAEGSMSQENNFGVPNSMAEKSEGLVATSVNVWPKVQPKNKMMIQRELLALKKKALALRREGRLDEADEELRKGKDLESQLEEMESGPSFKATRVSAPSKVSESPDISGVVYLGEEDDEAGVTEQDMQDPAMLKLLETLGWKDEDRVAENIPSRNSDLMVNHPKDTANSRVQSAVEIAVMAPKRSKAELQRELLGLKRKALTLRRQGETEEADEVLKKAKLLEAQMEEIEASKKELSSNSVTNTLESLGTSYSLRESQATKPYQNSLSEDVLHQNVHDPPVAATVSALAMSQSMENRAPLLDIAPPTKTEVVEHTGSFPQPDQSVNLVDLLTGNEWQSSQALAGEAESKEGSSTNTLPLDSLYAQSRIVKSSNDVPVSEDGSSFKNEEKSFGSVQRAPIHEADSTVLNNSQNSPSDLHQEILARKRKAVALKREGKLVEAREELRQAKLMEKNLQEDKPQVDAGPSSASPSTSSDAPFEQVERKTQQQAPKPMTGRDRFKLQQESLNHKRQALKLRREGRNAEADAEFELAKALEAQLEESSGQDTKSSKETEGTDDLGVEDLLDPQLLSALKAIGLQDTEMAPQAPNRPEATKPSVSKIDASASDQEKSKLEELIRAEKVKAVNLKRAGKQSEALDALRRAKLHEKKLKTLS